MQLTEVTALALAIALLWAVACGGTEAPAPTPVFPTIAPHKPTPYPTSGVGPPPNRPQPATGRAMTVTLDLPATGDALLDVLLRGIEARDVEYLLGTIDRARFSVADCSTPRQGSPSRDLSGADDATLRAALRAAFGDSDAATVFAADIWTTSKGDRPHYIVVVAQGGAPNPLAPALGWEFSPEGRLFHIGWCHLRHGAASTVGAPAEAYMGVDLPGPPALLPWRAYCADGDVEAIIEVRRVVDFLADESRITGDEFTRDGQPVGGLGVVRVRRRDAEFGYVYPIEPFRTPESRETAFNRLPRGVGDLAPGERIRVLGWRHPNCEIEAWEIAPV